MKQMILIPILSFITCIAYSQKIQDGIWGCKYGTNKEKIAETIKLQGFTPINDGNKIKVSNIEFGGIEFDNGTFYFYLDQLYMFEFSTTYTNQQKRNSTYSILKEMLKNKYGKPVKEYSKGNAGVIYMENINSVCLLNSSDEVNGITYYFLNLAYSNSPLLTKATNDL